MFYVFIPARGGSKSIKDKNLQKINGIPLVERSIKLALKKFECNQVVLSSDSNKILNIGEKYKINIHLRSSKTSNDTATTESAINEWLENKENKSEWIILLEPTSPFINISDIDRLIELCKIKNEVNCIYSVTEIRHTDHYLNQRVINNGKVQFLFDEERNKSKLKQKKIKTFKFGNISAIRTTNIIKSQKFFSKNSNIFDIPFVRSINIDSEEELFIARSLARYDRSLYDI
tara:strand:+ start:613 stop:1308 length:696 start_codon:yes stop_codon:yes gene_type:complete